MIVRSSAPVQQTAVGPTLRATISRTSIQMKGEGGHMATSRMCAVLLVLVAATLSAQTPSKPGPEHQRLNAFVGTWNTEGQAQESPYGPAGKLTVVDTFEWLPGGYFLSHKWDVKQGSAEFQGMEIIGFDARNKAYTSRFFDSLGNSGTLRGRLQGNAWTWTGDSDIAGRAIKERCTIIVVRADVFTNKCEYSADGVKWLPNFEQRSTRAQ
jgi:Protein of unknown function (DUF1579)